MTPPPAPQPAGVRLLHAPGLFAGAHDGFGGHQPPGTLLVVTVLGYRGQLVEVEAVAVRPAP